MKIYFVILLFINCGSGIFIKKNIEKEYYVTGELKYEMQKKNNKIDGYTRFWDIDGNIINEVNYSNGILHGEWKEYHINGMIKSQINYEYGLKNGLELWYYDNGIKKSETLYKDDVIIIDIIRWDKDGNLIYK